MTTSKVRKIHRRQRRQRKLRTLKKKYLQTIDPQEREKIVSKIRKISIYPEKVLSELMEK